jgi:hypothetical protein
VRQGLLQNIVNFSKRKYNTLRLCELAALCPFNHPCALEHIPETPNDFTLWLGAIQKGNLDRTTYATLFRLVRLLLSGSQSRLLNLLDDQISILQCRISSSGLTLQLQTTTREFTQHLMEKCPWHSKIRDLKMIDLQFSTMVPSLEAFEKSCVMLHGVQNDISHGNYYLPKSLSTADEVVDENIKIQLQAARNILLW